MGAAEPTNPEIDAVTRALRYHVARPTVGDEERKLVLDALETCWISSQGPYVDRVTAEFPPAVGAVSGRPCANGTAALHLALLALGAGPGDEVIVPNFTYVATANAPMFVGASPVLADVRESDWGLDVDRVAELISPLTKGVIASHLYGVVADLSGLRALCDRHGLWLVEDCAEVLGADPIVGPGRWGELSTWSFYANKVITCGEGGFVTTRTRPDLISRVESFRGQGVDPNRRYWHLHLGFNFRLTNLQCALLAAQLGRLPGLLEERARLQSQYRALLSEPIAQGLLLAVPEPAVLWLQCVAIPTAHPEGQRRDRVMAEMERFFGIETRPFFYPVDELPHFSGVRRGPQTISRKVARTGLNLPTYVGLAPADVEFIVESLTTVVSRVHDVPSP